MAMRKVWILAATFPFVVFLNNEHIFTEKVVTDMSLVPFLILTLSLQTVFIVDLTFVLLLDEAALQLLA